jgi:hypothetical protein
MNRLAIAVLVALVALPLFAAQGGAGWSTNGLFTNPPNPTVLADTGQFGQTIREFHLVIYASVAVTVDLQQRNGADTTTKMSQRLTVPAGQTVNFSGIADFLDRDHLRIITTGTVVGDVQASIFMLN